MAHKRRSISEKIYEELAAFKKEREVFTELIKCITPARKKKLSEFAGVMAGKEYDDFEKAALEARHFESSRSRR